MQHRSDLQLLFATTPALSQASVVHELGGGPVSDSWLIENQGERLVLRIDTPHARTLGLDRHAEIKILETVSAAGLGPRVIWADPGAGLLLSSYIPGQVWTEKNICDPAYLRQLAGTLSTLHALPATAPEFDPAGAALTYARHIGTAAALELANKAVSLTTQLLTPGRPRSLCHNDLVHSNIVGRDPVRLIDWEYAAMGDPLFDLAVVIQHHKLSDPVAEDFLYAYMGDIDHATKERLHAFCKLYDLLSGLWYMIFSKKMDTISGQGNSD